MSYRRSHIEDGAGERYDQALRARIDDSIWLSCVRPLVEKKFKEIRNAGGESYLDMACGTGRIVALGERYFRSSVGVDISSAMLKVARDRAPASQLYCSDVTAGDNAGFLRDRSFDCVSLFRFLLNAEPELRSRMLCWLYEHMSRGALLIGNIHGNQKSLFGGMTMAAQLLGFRLDRNIASRIDVEDLLFDHGFRVESWAGFRVLPTINGRSLGSRRAQVYLERKLAGTWLSRWGADQVFVARRL